jgi:hypothetical protein
LTNKTLLSTGGNTIEATRLQSFTVSSATPSTNIMNLAIAHKVDPKTGQIVAPTTLNVLADVSWQLFWESYRCEVFEKIPKDIWDKFDHKHGGSRKWHADNRDALNNMRLELKKSAQNI